MTQEELLSLIGMGPSPYTSSEYSSQGVPGAPLPPVGQPGDTVSVWGNPDAPAPGQTPLTQEQGFGALPPAQPPAAPAILPAKVSVDQSSSGYSADKANQIEAGPYGTKAAKSKDAGIRQEIEQRYAPFYKEMAGVTAELRAAEDAASQAEQAKIQAKAAGDLKISTMMAEHGNKMQKLNESALIAAQAAKDEYKARLLSIPEVNPTALWDNAGGEGRFAVGVAAFVHDFLGAKGIKTSAMDTINQAVSNNINAQIANINTKKQVAQGFKDLYDMTVQESASQMEVQAKLQGYMLKSLEAGIDAQMGQYDSNVARAKHLQAKAGIRQLQLKNMMEVEQHIDNAFNQAVGHEVTREGQRIQASVAHERAKTDIEVAKIHANAAKNKEEKPPIYIFDPETKKGVLKIRKGVPESLQKEVLEKASDFYQADKEMLKLRDMERKLDPTTPGFTGTRFSDQDQRLYQATTKRLAHNMLAAMGERATDKDVDQFLESLPTKVSFTNGGISRILADTHQAMHQKLDGLIMQTTEDVPEEEQPGMAKNLPFQGSKTSAEIGTNGQDVHKPTEIENAVKQATAPDSMKPTAFNDSDEFQTFTKAYWEDYKKSANRIYPADQDLTPQESASKQVGAPPKAFDALRTLAEIAYEGDDAAKTQLRVQATPQDTSEEALTRAEMAKYFLNKLDAIKKNPAENPLGASVAGFGYPNN